VKVDRKDLVRVIAVVAVLWVATLFLLAKWQRSGGPSGGPSEPELIHYPGYEGVPEQTSPNIGWRKYWFELNETYPSKSVYHFYRHELASRGWQLLGRGDPQWIRQTDKDQHHDIFQAIWIGPDRLFQIELQMKSEVDLIKSGDQVVGEERSPTILVYVTMRRAVAPQILLEPRSNGTSSGGRGMR
jgi:hypothetical protein